jgi:hypothetical protein
VDPADSDALSNLNLAETQSGRELHVHDLRRPGISWTSPDGGPRLTRRRHGPSSPVGSARRVDAGVEDQRRGRGGRRPAR